MKEFFEGLGVSLGQMIIAFVVSEAVLVALVVAVSYGAQKQGVFKEVRDKFIGLDNRDNRMKALEYTSIAAFLFAVIYAF